MAPSPEAPFACHSASSIGVGVGAEVLGGVVEVDGVGVGVGAASAGASLLFEKNIVVVDAVRDRMWSASISFELEEGMRRSSDEDPSCSKADLPLFPFTAA